MSGWGSGKVHPCLVSLLDIWTLAAQGRSDSIGGFAVQTILS